jgi:hypothetical protein
LVDERHVRVGLDPSKGTVVSPATAGADDMVWNPVGDQIESVEWSGPVALGSDPFFHLRSGAILQVFSDAAFDTWDCTHPFAGPSRTA